MDTLFGSAATEKHRKYRINILYTSGGYEYAKEYIEQNTVYRPEIREALLKILNEMHAKNCPGSF